MGGEMVVCPWNEFWRDYSPWIPSKDVVLKGVEVLEGAKLLIESKWVDEVDPATGPNENVGFRPLQKVARELEGLKIKNRDASYRLLHKPTQPASSTIPAGNHMVDGCVYPIEHIPNDPATPLETQRMASVYEYKPARNPRLTYDVSFSQLSRLFWLTDIGQNRLKVVSAANYAMNKNPERMFIYGVMMISFIRVGRFLICPRSKITIEADNFALWYFSRSHSAMSQPFNWMEARLRILIVADLAEWAFL